MAESVSASCIQCTPDQGAGRLCQTGSMLRCSAGRELYVHVVSFNRNMKVLGVLESKWDPIRKKLVRRLVEEQDKVLRSYRCSYFAQKGGTRSKGGDRSNGKGREHVHGTCMREEGVCVCFITAGPITKLCAWGEEESGGHVL